MRFLNYLLHSFVITLLTFLVLLLFSLIPLNLEILNPVQDVFSDFDMSDMVFSKLRDEQNADDRIVLVNFGDLSRAELGQMIGILNKHEPKVIGIDAFYRKLKTSSPEEISGDSLLAANLAQTKNLVLISGLPMDKFNEKKKEYDSLETSNALFMKNAKTGFANLITEGSKHEFNTTRTFSPSEKIKGKVEYAFGVKVAQMYDEKQVQGFLARANEYEFINFRGNIGNDTTDPNNSKPKFIVLDWHQVLNSEFDPKAIKDKIILIGYMGPNLQQIINVDNFYTPLNKNYVGRSTPDMYGIVVHANIVSMILTGNYINNLSTAGNLMVAFIFTMIMVMLMAFLYKNVGIFFDGLGLISQVVMAVIFLFFTVYSFDWYLLRINISYAILGIFLSGLLVEIYYGLILKMFSKKQK
ncbi:MAG: CHASE2 domain-containing protein [Cytophagales bacterium]|nr:MAG: CHASE2 domain-containing protein [Cytophagales bacterium]